MKSGDGNIQLADCTSPESLLEVFSRALDVGPTKVCFRVTGPSGYLALELPKVYSLKGDDHTVRATLNRGGSVSSMDLRKNYYNPVGEGSSAEGATLLELSATDGPATPAATGELPAVGLVVVGQPGRSGSRSCTATLVDRYWALTTAGCFTDGTLGQGAPATRSTLAVGGQSVEISELVPRADRDVVLARLATPVMNVAPAVLSGTAPVTEESLRVPGYGRTATQWRAAGQHTTTHTVGSVSATGVESAPAAGAAAICAGAAGAPFLREKDGKAEVVAVASRSWHGGCFGTPASETRTGAQSARVDDLAGWVQQVSSGWWDTLTANPVAGSSVYNPATKTAEVFSLDADGHVVHSYSTNGGTWSSWSMITDWQFAGAPTAVYNPATGAIELFAIGRDGTLSHAYWTAANNWSTWYPIGSDKFTGSPAAVYNPATKTAEVFAVRTDGKMAHSYSTNGGTWSSWSMITDWQFAGAPTAVYNPATGAIELFAIGR
ncbi:trypsin-like serine protease, partial [Kitasatospora sp. NPDC047058]|uniref:trypsin-like serine protease n=1 Tax=Kitasatospora sp. NPDC047058 TaxID=3155620 RepID=UPI0033CB70F7